MKLLEGKFIVEHFHGDELLSRTEFENKIDTEGRDFILDTTFSFIPPLEEPDTGEWPKLWPIGAIHFPEPITVLDGEDLRVYTAPHDYQI
jgi:hypothetical protein